MSHFVLFLLFFTIVSSEGKEYQHKYVISELTIKKGKARILVSLFDQTDQLLTGMRDDAIKAAFRKQIVESIDLLAHNKYQFILRSVDVEYDENLQKTRDKLLDSALGIPYDFRRSELEAFLETKVDALLFISANIEIQDTFGSKKVKAGITNPNTKKSKVKKSYLMGAFKLLNGTTVF